MKITKKQLEQIIREALEKERGSGNKIPPPAPVAKKQTPAEKSAEKIGTFHMQQKDVAQGRTPMVEEEEGEVHSDIPEVDIIEAENLLKMILRGARMFAPKNAEGAKLPARMLVPEEVVMQIYDYFRDRNKSWK